MMPRQVPAQRCNAIAKIDGQRCGKMAAPGELLCHIHLGKGRSPIIPPDDEIDEIKILKRLARSRDDTTARHAAMALLEIKQKQQKGCAVCAAHAEHSRKQDDALKRMTESQREDFALTVKRFFALIEEALDQPVQPEVAPPQRQLRFGHRTSRRRERQEGA
jgi:hypothetical protein